MNNDYIILCKPKVVACFRLLSPHMHLQSTLRKLTKNAGQDSLHLTEIQTRNLPEYEAELRSFHFTSTFTTAVL